jgi:DNA-binding transcriptional regulator GbsR (MarR family)
MNKIEETFVLHWGEMGTRWGINRTVAQIHALLYLSPKPLTADEIAATLSVARSNVSTSLRELQGWGIVKVVHELGDRRDHFESMKDVWAMFQIIVEERKRREVDPTIAMLQSCSAEAENSAEQDAYLRTRLKDMLSFFEAMTSCYQEVRKVPPSALRGLLKMKDRFAKFLEV